MMMGPEPMISIDLRSVLWARRATIQSVKRFIEWDSFELRVDGES